LTGERRACRLDELEASGSLAVDFGDLRVALFHEDGKVFALNETCPHRGGPLHLGQVVEGVVRCPWHLWQFDLTTGESPVNPDSRVPAYPVSVRDGEIWVRIPEAGQATARRSSS